MTREQPSVFFMVIKLVSVSIKMANRNSKPTIVSCFCERLRLRRKENEHSKDKLTLFPRTQYNDA